uniref:Acyl-CoA thioesterase-like C-terminal domain-containing protein n=1 Tax=Chromera velia CCMP2878 TaxID=1169474 RepID=A0A0G4HHU8_9ALVE|eukprot:Cvel_1057.t1-p1 / transcript=Cvel_1057.t1 / gene=Cvel_1057 / organism=Chromera_velia_CCMP2878 / gene_product=hypothetical protein / transcript_product=hypothetical protein / location=Cvel_scaffold34:100439-101047(+) / protein_length=203 / sequence_SO=supercontig / SO=protein_coding / is_pseudo=false
MHSDNASNGEIRNVTGVEAKLMQCGAVTRSLTACFRAGRPILSVPPSVSSRTDLPKIEDCPVWKLGEDYPGFLQNYEVRWYGGKPFEKKTCTRFARLWLGIRGQNGNGAICEKPLNVTPTLVALADMPPAIISLHYDQPIQSSSLTWFLKFVQPPDQVRMEWLYLEYELLAASEGYSQQNGTVFDQHGNLIVLSRQNMVYFEP